MKKTVELTILSRKVIRREVEFPIYSKHDLDSEQGEDIYYHRVDADMRRVTVRFYSHWFSGDVSYEIEVTHSFCFSRDSEDYSLGKGVYTCTAEEFNRALGDAIAFAESMKVIS